MTTQATTTSSDLQPKILDQVSSGVDDLVITHSSRNRPLELDQQIEAFERVVASGSPLIAIGDVDTVSEEALLCVQRAGFDVTNNECPSSLDDMRSDNLSGAAAEVPGAHLIDLMNYFCNGDTCPAVIGNVPVYRDKASHLTQTYAEGLSPFLIAEIQRLIPTTLVVG